MAKKEEVKKKGAAKKATVTKPEKKAKAKEEEEEEEEKNLGAGLEEEEEEEEDEADEEVDEEEGEDEDGDGEVDSLSPRVQEVDINGKKAYFPLCFIANVVDKKGKLLKIAGFNEKGQRVTPWVAPDEAAAGKGDLPPAKKIAKDIARMNALRRQKMLPDDYLRQVPVKGVISAE